MRSREPRCHQNGMDARRRDAARGWTPWQGAQRRRPFWWQPSGSGVGAAQSVVASSWCVSTHGVLGA